MPFPLLAHRSSCAALLAEHVIESALVLRVLHVPAGKMMREELLRLQQHSMPFASQYSSVILSGPFGSFVKWGLVACMRGLTPGTACMRGLHLAPHAYAWVDTWHRMHAWVAPGTACICVGCTWHRMHMRGLHLAPHAYAWVAPGTTCICVGCTWHHMHMRGLHLAPHAYAWVAPGTTCMHGLHLAPPVPGASTLPAPGSAALHSLLWG